MELTQVQQNDIMIPDAQVVSLPTEDNNGSNFLEANTKEVTFQHLKNDTIIPVFSKDNELTIPHWKFIEATQNAIFEAFPDHKQAQPNIRVSHVIKGRVPSAIGKAAKELLPHESQETPEDDNQSNDLVSISKQLKKAVTQYKQQAEELQKLNKLMVNRELKMIELKEKNHKLSDTVTTNDPSPPAN